MVGGQICRKNSLYKEALKFQRANSDTDTLPCKHMALVVELHMRRLGIQKDFVKVKGCIRGTEGKEQALVHGILKI